MRVKLISVFVIIMFAFVGLVMAQEAAKKPAFIGADKCKTCHTKDETHPSWLTSKHATAYDKLPAEEQAKEEIKKYYTTGTTADGKFLTGVQCEACHGAGSDYKSMAIMKDATKATAAGLIMPDAKACMTCHNDKAPAAVAAIAKDFDFAKAVEKGVHKMKAKEAAPAAAPAEKK